LHENVSELRGRYLHPTYERVPDTITTALWWLSLKRYETLKDVSLAVELVKQNECMMSSWYIIFITNKYIDWLTFLVHVREMAASVLEKETGRFDGLIGY
jgi:hypothetical protein